MLCGDQEARCRLVAGALPVRDHLARTRSENTIGSVSVEAKRCQRHLNPLAVGWRESQRRFGSLRCLLSGGIGGSFLLRLGGGLLLGFGSGLLLGLGSGLLLGFGGSLLLRLGSGFLLGFGGGLLLGRGIGFLLGFGSGLLLRLGGCFLLGFGRGLLLSFGRCLLLSFGRCFLLGFGIGFLLGLGGGLLLGFGIGFLLSLGSGLLLGFGGGFLAGFRRSLLLGLSSGLLLGFGGGLLLSFGRRLLARLGFGFLLGRLLGPLPLCLRFGRFVATVGLLIAKRRWRRGGLCREHQIPTHRQDEDRHHHAGIQLDAVLAGNGQQLRRFATEPTAAPEGLPYAAQGRAPSVSVRAAWVQRRASRA